MPHQIQWLLGLAQIVLSFAQITYPRFFGREVDDLPADGRQLAAYCSADWCDHCGVEGESLDTSRGAVAVRLPKSFVNPHSKPWPLVIYLHGYTSCGREVLAYPLNLLRAADWLLDNEGDATFQAIHLAPDGSTALGARYWNAGACCDFLYRYPDDVSFMREIIEAAKVKYNIDGERIYVFGHSNGGFLSHRLACELSDTLAAIASLAGPLDTECVPSRPFPTLTIWGTNDAVVKYEGGRWFWRWYPGADNTLETWGQLNECAGEKASSVRIENEDVVIRQKMGCKANVGSELWSVVDAGHLIGGLDFSVAVVKWLFQWNRSREDGSNTLQPTPSPTSASLETRPKYTVAPPTLAPPPTQPTPWRYEYVDLEADVPPTPSKIMTPSSLSTVEPPMLAPPTPWPTLRPTATSPMLAPPTTLHQTLVPTTIESAPTSPTPWPTLRPTATPPSLDPTPTPTQLRKKRNKKRKRKMKQSKMSRKKKGAKKRSKRMIADSMARRVGARSSF